MKRIFSSGDSHLWKVRVEGTGQDASGDSLWLVLTRNPYPVSFLGRPWKIPMGCFVSRVHSIPVMFMCLLQWNHWPTILFTCYLDTQAPSQVCFHLCSVITHYTTQLFKIWLSVIIHFLILGLVSHSLKWASIWGWQSWTLSGHCPEPSGLTRQKFSSILMVLYRNLIFMILMRWIRNGFWVNLSSYDFKNIYI